MCEISNKAAGSCRRECKTVTPDIPLKRDDRETSHAAPDHGESGLATGKTRVEEADSGVHDENHAGADDDVGLIAGLEPLIEVRRGCVSVSIRIMS